MMRGGTVVEDLEVDVVSMTAVVGLCEVLTAVEEMATTKM